MGRKEGGTYLRAWFLPPPLCPYSPGHSFTVQCLHWKPCANYKGPSGISFILQGEDNKETMCSSALSSLFMTQR